MTTPMLNAFRSALKIHRAGTSAMLWLQFFLLLICTLFAAGARAGTCSYTPSFPAEKTTTVPFNATITVGRDAPVGTVLYQQIVATGTNGNIFTVSCTPGTYTYQYGYASTPYPLSSYVHPTWGRTIYQTSVPGIGAVVANGNAALPITVDTMNFTALTNYSSTATIYMVAYLVKIADQVGSGTIKGSDWPVFESSMVGGNVLRLNTTPFTGTVNVVSSTCTTPNVNVNMGTHFTTELNGVGSTTAWVKVPIPLVNCPAFYGKWSSTYTAGGSTTYTQIAQNTIGYSVSPTSGVANAANGVMNLASGGATGVGIQLTNTSGAPTQFNTVTNSGLNLNQTSGGGYTIDLQARYFQTGASVTAGAANATATVTLTYL